MAMDKKTANNVVILLMILATMTGSTLAIFRMSLKKIESERSKRIRLGLPHKSRTLSFSSPPYAAVVTDYSDIEYIGTVYLGSRREPLRVVLDTGSADFWVPDISCGICDYYCHGLPTSFCHKLCDKGCCSIENNFTQSKCAHKRTFNAAKSTTYTHNDGTWQIKYGSGMAAGFYGRDIVDLGGMNINVTFGQATIVDAQIIEAVNLDGILGLAFRSLSVGDIQPPFLAAVDQKIIDNATFTVFLRKTGYPGSEDGGLITFGGFDNINCEPQINYVHLRSATYYQFSIEKFYFGPTQIGATYQEVISDTGTSFIAAPVDVVFSVATAIGAKQDMYGFTVPCNHGQFPNMTLIIGGHEYTITSDSYIVQRGPRRCDLALSPFDNMGVGPTWILGDPFIREYCNVHDMKGRRIGFAKSIQK